MSKHRLTITIVLDVADDECHQDALAAIKHSTAGLLEDGTIPDWILDAAAMVGEVGDDTVTVSATCALAPETGAGT